MTKHPLTKWRRVDHSGGLHELLHDGYEIAYAQRRHDGWLWWHDIGGEHSEGVADQLRRAKECAEASVLARCSAIVDSMKAGAR